MSGVDRSTVPRGLTQRPTVVLWSLELVLGAGSSIWNVDCDIRVTTGVQAQPEVDSGDHRMMESLNG